MTRKEHLEFCKKCLNRKTDIKQGLLCNITGQIADFEESCSNFKLDETVKEELSAIESTPNMEVINDLSESDIDKLKIHQDFYYAIVGGLSAMLISAIIWAVITVATQYQIGYMAIGVGLLVGFTVQFFGAGIDKKFGFLGAGLSLLGCMLGNLFSQVGFIAQEQSLGYFETLTYLNFELIGSIMTESFSPMDVLFYGFAVWEGYKFAFRKITVELLAQLKSESYDASPKNYKLRMPLAVASSVLLVILFFFFNRGVSGYNTYTYESGAKMSEGELKNSEEVGRWNYYYENGNLQLSGFYSSGTPDSLWIWYNESGQVLKKGNYRNGIEHGTWMTFYENGLPSDSGSYYEGRLQGLWKQWYESGTLYQKGYYSRNNQDSIWHTYYDNGQLSSVGLMVENVAIGDWQIYYSDGQMAQELFHEENSDIRINNAWNPDGEQLVKDGNGFFQSYSENGIVVQSGKVEKACRVGTWSLFYEDGRIREEGSYDGEIYRVQNVWDIDESKIVKDGNGDYISYYADGSSILEKGKLVDGFREGDWEMYYEASGNLYQQTMYAKGKLSGLQTFYSESGQVLCEGVLENDLREGEWKWYYENGLVSSAVSYEKDEKVGRQIMWNEFGEKTKEEIYDKGRLVEEETF